MEQNAQREVRTANPDWSVSDVMAHVAKALKSDKPALAFGAVQSTHVPSRVSIVIRTTGSSGTPKEVGVSAEALLASAKASNKYLGAQAGDTWSLLLPLTHIAGVNVLVRALDLGTEPIDLRGERSEYPRVDFTAIVPAQLFKALNGDDALLQHLVAAKSVLIGGAALPNDLRKQGEEAGVTIVTTYGMTETTGGCVYNGTPLDGVEISITSENLVAIKGAVLAETYIGAEQMWASAVKDGGFVTADLGKIEGGKLIVEGRSDDVIISGGENISLGHIERTLQARFPEVTFAAFSMSNPQWGDSLHLAVVGKDIVEEEISGYLALEVGPFAKVKGFLHLPELPLMGIGKVDRRKLAELFTEASH
jgi:O-succinylbenzoic acid--CoA ligase